MQDIKIYFKDYCPYCQAAKAQLNKLGWQYTEIDVQDDKKAFAEMVALSGRKTVPQIFIAGDHIGGFDDFQHYLKQLSTLSLDNG